MTMYLYAWRNNEKRVTLYGRICRVVARGAMNSALVEFADTGQREVISRNALRKYQPPAGAGSGGSVTGPEDGE